MIDFIEDAERQYENYCDLAKEYGFLDRAAANSGFRCTTKKSEFNAGWIAWSGAVASCRDEFFRLKAKIAELEAKAGSKEG
ncbi:hypothetical protein [Acinetobacter pittii]|uniref:hypothetical protein n=1 Tax=Acinetobacter pittii TaxID=48296 RepID=UPI00192CD790|nr:hypothetical protein [Acinetobacter pittii]